MKIGDRTKLPDGRCGTITTMRGAARSGQRWCSVRLDDGGIVFLYLETGEENDRLMVNDVSVGDAFELVIGSASAMPVQSQIQLLAHALIATARAA